MRGRVRTEAETEGRGHKPGDPGGLDAGGGREEPPLETRTALTGAADKQRVTASSS